LQKAHEKIIKVLKNDPIHSYNAPALKKKTGLNLNTIHSELRRLFDKKLIVRESHGFYRIKHTAETISFLEKPPTLLHGIMVSMNMLRKLQKGIHGITADSCKLDEDLVRFGFVKKSNKRFVCSFYYQDDSHRLVTITVHSVGRVDVYLNCSNHPVNYFEFRDVLNFVKGKLFFLGSLVDQRVIQFGMGKDFKSIRLEGASSLSLRVFMSHWFRVYNKESLGVCRVEQHVKCDVSVDTFVSLFERMFVPVGNDRSFKEDDFVDVA